MRSHIINKLNIYITLSSFFPLYIIIYDDSDDVIGSHLSITMCDDQTILCQFVLLALAFFKWLHRMMVKQSILN
jgi:hypothetical protein